MTIDTLNPPPGSGPGLAASRIAASEAAAAARVAGPAGAPLPKTKPDFEANSAFADMDRAMNDAMNTLSAGLKSPLIGGKISAAQLAELAKGKLGARPLDPTLAELKNAALLLSTADAKPYLNQLKLPLTVASVEAARKAGFEKAHEEIIKSNLTAYAAALAGPLKTLVPKALTKDQLNVILLDGNLAGKSIRTLIPDEKTREAFLDAAAMMTDNRRLFEAVGPMNADQLKKLVAGQTVPMVEAPYNWQATLADAVRLSMPVKTDQEPKVDILDPKWTSAKMKLLVSEYDAFIKSRQMVPFHEAWHSVNGSGGTKNKGSGEWFIQFHAQMGGDFVEFMKMRGTADGALVDGSLPEWRDMTRPIPAEFIKPPSVKNNIRWKPPAFLQPKNALGAGPATMNLDGRRITCLDDITSMDELGRVLGESGAHAVAHIELNDGLMPTFKSVAAPPFILWHYGAIEKFRHEWLKTDSGMKWLEANPQGWTQPNLDAHDAVMDDVRERRQIATPGSSTFEPAGAPVRRDAPIMAPGSTRGGPVTRGAPPAEAAPRTRAAIRAEAKVAREARRLVEELCLTSSNPDGVMFSKDEILEASQGFVDAAKQEEGKTRTKTRRDRDAREATDAAGRVPWGRR